MTERTRLPGLAAAGDIRANVKRVAESGQCKRLKDEAADCFDIEIFIKVLPVQDSEPHADALLRHILSV